MTAYRFMACFAHPDDEAFSIAGVAALNRRRGIRSILVCATKGEAGEVSDPALVEAANLGEVRAAELTAAARHIGINELLFLGYRDSGMAGTPDNDHPAAYARAADTAVVERLVYLLRSRRPHVIVTFDPTGGYGHPDHIAIHRHTLAAFHAAADPTHSPHLGPAWQAQRLFYPTFNPDFFTALRDQLLAQGEEPPDWGEDDSDFQLPDQQIHARVDISSVIDAKWAALFSHRTQLGPRHPFRRVPESFMHELLSQETFELAWPTQKPAHAWPDLFHGLNETT